jgi:hypothetical protein
VRGFITSAADTFSFDDANATFVEGGIPGLGGLSGAAGLSPFLDEQPLGMAGACVYFRDPNGAFTAADGSKWDQRTVWASTKQRVYYTPPSAAPIAAGTEYMLGPINWYATLKPSNLGKDSTQKRTIDLFLVHVPEEFDSVLKIEFLPDFSAVDERAGAISSDDTGIPGDRTMLMSSPKGRQNVSIGRVKHAYMGYKLSNFAPEQPIRVLNVVPTFEETP